MSSIWLAIMGTVLPFLLAALAGLVLAKTLPPVAVRRASRAVAPIVWGILWVIGVSTGEVLGSFSQGLNALKQGLTYALATSAFSFLLLLPLSKRSQTQARLPWWQSLLHPLKECALAFALVGSGIACYRLGWLPQGAWVALLDINLWLYVLLFLIGMELTQQRISRAWLSAKVLIVPLLVILGSLLAGAVVSLISGEKLSTALALSSGFGWFSLSGGLAGQHLGEHYAAVALLTDLLRELIGMTVVFLLGSRFAQASIGVCGATAADTTLPFVRKSCDYDYLPVALMSGLVLTIAAPLLMLFFMSLNIRPIYYWKPLARKRLLKKAALLPTPSPCAVRQPRKKKLPS